MTEEHLRVMFSSPRLDLATSARPVLDPGGDLVAAGFVFHRDPYVTVHARGLVGEAHQRLGRALLFHAFREFRRRGTSKVSLHVDAQSHTGATRLYESAGMHVDELSHESELELRPGVDLAVKGSAD